MVEPVYESKIQVISAVVRDLEILADDNLNIDLNAILFRRCKEFNLKNPPRRFEILLACPDRIRKYLTKIIKFKPIRTLSGIAIIAVMARPHRCPHIYYTGQICVYCPGGPDSDFQYSSQAYTGYEPTSKLAISCRYDPFLQVRTKIDILEASGHTAEKIELIILGGTFMSLQPGYRDRFIADMHDALSGHRGKSLPESIFYSEHSLRYRCIGLTIETRPDYCQNTHLKSMLSYGCTRIEIGIQSIYEDVALDTNRGHTVEAVCHSLQLSKEHGFKITAHMMPNLPNICLERDIYQFEEFFNNPEFRSDGLKIYPTLVIRGTGIYELWKTKRYENYSSGILIDLIAHIMSIVPPWVRIYRVQREIPMPLVSSCGVARNDLRVLVGHRMKALGLVSRDIRGREVGIKELHEDVKIGQLELVRRDYYANGGWETFLSYEDWEQDVIVGFLRLRKCVKNPITGVKFWSVIRELHIYGQTVGVSERDTSKYQHQGYGESLVNEAERISKKEHGSSQMGIISGVGVRNYYRKLGYQLEEPYMVKNLK